MDVPVQLVDWCLKHIAIEYKYMRNSNEDQEARQSHNLKVVSSILTRGRAA